MKWNIVFLLSLTGAVVGTASLFGLTEGIELYWWIVIALLTAYFLAKQTSHKLFLHGFYSGIGMGICHVLILFIFFDLYVLHNPTSANGFTSIPGNLEPRIFLLITSPVIGGLYGLVLGALAQIAAKFHIPK